MVVIWSVLFLVPAYGLADTFIRGSALQKRQFPLYYTSLSNILAAAYFLLLILLPANSRLERLLLRPLPALAVAWTIFITFLIYHFVLVPGFKADPLTPEQQTWMKRPSNYVLHYGTPLLTLAYWLIFADKTGLRVNHIFLLLLLPLAYVTIILLRGGLGGAKFYKSDSRYPYAFLNVDVYGLPRVLLVCLLLAIFFFLLGLFFLLLARIVS